MTVERLTVTEEIYSNDRIYFFMNDLHVVYFKAHFQQADGIISGFSIRRDRILAICNMGQTKSCRYRTTGNKRIVIK